LVQDALPKLSFIQPTSCVVVSDSQEMSSSQMPAAQAFSMCLDSDDECVSPKAAFATGSGITGATQQQKKAVGVVSEGAQAFSMSLDSDDDFVPGSSTSRAPRQKKMPAPRPLQNFCLSDNEEEGGAVTPPPPPLSPPRKAPQFFPLPDDGSEKSASPAKSLRSVHHREGLGFSLCEDSDAEDVSEGPSNKRKQSEAAKTKANEDRAFDPIGLHKLGGARILGKHLAAVHKHANTAKSRSAAGSVAPSIADDDAASVVSAVESVAASETSTISRASRASRASRDSSGAARLFGRHLQGVKSDVAVDKAAKMIVEPESVKGHVDDVMCNLSLRQRQEVQRHIDAVMRSAAERMGYKTLAEKQDLCERANHAICDALDRQQSESKYFKEQEPSHDVDPEWDLALRAKIRLAMCAARERRTASGLEQAIAAAQNAAYAKRGSSAEALAYEDIESRILWAAHEACQRRGGPAVEAEAARVPRHMSGVPSRTFRSSKPRVEIPAGKLDQCIHRIVTDAKARTEAKDQPPAVVARGQRSHPLKRAALYNDVELADYFSKVVAEAAARANELEASQFEAYDYSQAVDVYSEANSVDGHDYSQAVDMYSDKVDGQDYSQAVGVYSESNGVDGQDYSRAVDVYSDANSVDGHYHSQAVDVYPEANGVARHDCCEEEEEEVKSPRKWGGC